MKFNTYFFGSLGIEKTRRCNIIIINFRIGGIMTNNNIIFFGKVDCCIEKV